jgi:GTP-binding protein Era
MTTAPPFRSGFVALIGRPNSGKSTLLNAVLGEELAPVTPMPQTTRRAMKGICTTDRFQIVFVDTPGIHKGKHQLNETMLREAQGAATGGAVDCIGYVVDLSRDYGDEETEVARIALAARAPLLLVFNKTDLCPAFEAQKAKFFAQFPAFAQAPSIALAAVDKKAGQRFLAALQPFIKEGPRYFEGDSLTDENMRFFAAEFLRKHIILNTREEVPHAVFVEIEYYRETPSRHDIGATIHVETTGQRGIIIGKKGALLGKIRAAAENELRRLAGCPVHISCHIKVSPHWRDDKRFLETEFLA